MADELRKAAKKVRSLPNQMVRAGVKQISGPLDTEYRHAAGGDGRLSGVPNMRPFKARSSVRGKAVAKGRVSMTPAGPAKWINDGTRPRPQGSGQHPGTRGKQTFDRTVDAKLDQALREMEKVFGRAFR